jgi:hypothetical protein
MFARFASRVAAGVAVALLALVPLAACGGGYHHHNVFEGTLEVENDATGTLDIVRIDIDEVGGPDSFTYDPVSIVPGETFSVDLFPDQYDVTIFWEDSTFETQTVDILDNYTTTIVVANP